jgi:hypothetical protein
MRGNAARVQGQLMGAGYVIVIGDQSQKPKAGGELRRLERRVRQGCG